MDCTITCKGDRITLAVEGQFDMDAAHCLQPVIDLVRIIKPRVVEVDFEKVEFLGSAGVGLMLQFQREMLKLHGDLKILNMNEHMRQVFTISGLETYFDL